MKNVVALISMLLMSLLTSAALGAERDIEDYGHSSNGFFPEVGNLKNQKACPAGTKFFKNVAPGLTNGSGIGSTATPIEFAIDGEIVSMSISWDTENSFGFTLTGGVAHIVGVTSDTNNFLYDYVNFYDAVNRLKDPPPSNTPVFTDGNLNSIPDAADVNHLDLCLALVDTTPPVITFISPLDGDTVSGTVEVIVTATDPSGVDPNSVTVSVNDGAPESMTCVPEGADSYRCTYNWLTTVPGEELPAGSYTITVEAKDGAEPTQNTKTVTITVELVNSLKNCFGILGEEDFPNGQGIDPYANGCNPTGQVNVQAAPDTDVCNVDDPPAFCFIAGNRFKPDPVKIAALPDCDACAENYCGEFGLPDPRMELVSPADPRCSGPADCWVPKVPLEPLYIATVAQGNPPGALGEYVYGYKGCFAAAQHIRGGELIDLYPTWPAQPATGLVWIKTHAPDASISPGPVASCNVGLPDAAQAGYFPIGKTQSVDTTPNGIQAITLAATQYCQNPARTLSRDNGVDVSNIIETDGSDDPLAFKYQMAQMQFDALFVALECAEPTFLRRGKSRFSNVTSPTNQAKAQFDNGTIAALGRARDDLNDAAAAIRTSNWSVTPDNCAGDALARTENLAWRMTDLICAGTTPGAGDCSESPYP